MASKNPDSAILNLGDIGEENAFSSTITPSMENIPSSLHTFEDKIPDSALDLDEDEADIRSNTDTTGLLGDNHKQVNYNFWSLSFYGQFFDVDTEDVRKRLIWSVLPRPNATMDFLRRSIRPKPDLYGPFWVCVTLVFSVAISGNVAAYLQTAVKEDVKGFRWHYDFHKVTLAASAVFGYAWLVPAALYAFLWWVAGSPSAKTDSASFLELLCVYGYSLAIYIPVSVLWTIQNSAFQWTLVLAGAGLSGAVLLLAIWPSIKDHAKNVGFILAVVVIFLHILLACGFMLYFFHVPATSLPEIDPNETKDMKNSASVKNDANNGHELKTNIQNEKRIKGIGVREVISKNRNDPDIRNSAADISTESTIEAKQEKHSEVISIRS